MKKIRKILPLSIYDIPGIERWLEEQANNGLFPSFIDAWVTFTPNAVPGTRFRLEPYGKTGTEPTEEQLMLYREAGWEYAFAVGKVYFLFYTTDPEAVELYSDHESHGLSIERLEQRVHKYQRTRRVIYSLLAVGLVWAVFFHQSKYDVQPDRFARMPLLLLELFSPILLTFLLIAAFSWWRNRRDIRILSETCRALKEGFPPPASPGPSKGIVWEQRIALALIPVLLILNVISYMGTHGNMAKPLDEFSLPYSLLAPEQYETAQGAMATLPDGTQQEYRLYLDHFRTLSPAVAEVAYHGKIAERKKELEEYRKNWEENSPSLHSKYPNAYDYVRQHTLDDSSLDDLYVFTYQFSDREHPNVHYVGRYGEQVFTMMCTGGIDGEAALALLTERLTAR